VSEKETVLITGCGNGLGLALAHQLQGQGYQVFAGIREMASAEKLPSSAIPLLLDVTNEQHIKDAVIEVAKSGYVLKTLINNAGVHIGGPVENTSGVDVQRIFDVNFFGVLAVTRAFLPLFREQRYGHIMMLSSLSGLVALPGDGIYAASKHALEAASESLASEVRYWNINVTLLQPGAYATNLLRSQTLNPPEGPYQNMLPEPDQQGEAAGPENAAIDIAGLVDNPPKNLRYPIGGKAQNIVEKVSSLSQEERKGFITKVSGTKHWVNKEL